MSLYYEAAEVLTAPANAGGSLKSRIFKKELKSQPAQIYAIAIETCKWSPILKEVIENADILRLERKLTPILSLLLVHDLLLAKKGIALPATHGLRTSVERHKGRLQAELTRARIRRKLGTIEALKAHVETGIEHGADTSEAPYPRWIRINTLKTTLEDQLDTTFSGYEQVTAIDQVRQRGSKRLHIDSHIPNLIAISPNIDLSKSEAYKSGCIIFQDKASCFPAYLLDPVPEDGDVVDTCSAPGNKTTHLAAILVSHCPEPDESTQVIHAFEKNKGRAETLQKMVGLAGSDGFTHIHPGFDFLKTDSAAPSYKNVGALLLDPSCSGSGIVGRDDMPELHLPALKQHAATISKPGKKGTKAPEASKPSSKRVREEEEPSMDIMVDDDGVVTAVNTDAELKTRLEALSAFQLELLLHAFKYPAAKKITYSTCSIHAEENEVVVMKALESDIAKKQGWRLLSREKQVTGMRDWPVRGSVEAANGNSPLADACIRANKGDGNGTMGFFVAAFVRNGDSAPEPQYLRDDQGHIIRDMMGIPVADVPAENPEDDQATPAVQNTSEVVDEWNGFGDEEADIDLAEPPKATERAEPSQKKPKLSQSNKHAFKPGPRKSGLVGVQKKKSKRSG
ncbi:S-adenosyl-L-methionine-dependent methyltransferase-14 [Coleophoma cylindrospora]|uniref:S-adenosyl-L-methionine-dependent methyltransferase-14 n=1 Tax=Coleophoma cylindrospora TaxID=1849047 RepID=A0A3D8RAQ7_9HELO|nr:S-adenosyl-L-methionine-dependent methyltransferase-14 [Coleophoma cylindrospora]